MANTQARSEDFKTELCRLSYAQALFKARSQEEGGKKKFSPTLIFLKSYKQVLEKIVAKVISEQWGLEGLKRASKMIIKSPFLAGDGKEAHSKKTGDLHPGMGPDVFFVRATANEDRQPYVWFRNPEIREVDDSEVYSGCFGKAVLNAFTWANAAGGEGVSFGISKFQKLKEGERLGNPSAEADADKWHETIADEGPAPETTKNGGGAAGLFGD